MLCGVNITLDKSIPFQTWKSATPFYEDNLHFVYCEASFFILSFCCVCVLFVSFSATFAESIKECLISARGSHVFSLSTNTSSGCVQLSAVNHQQITQQVHHTNRVCDNISFCLSFNHLESCFPLWLRWRVLIKLSGNTWKKEMISISTLATIKWERTKRMISTVAIRDAFERTF